MRGRAQPRRRADAAPLTQVAAGRARYGDADGGRDPEGATAPRPPLRLAEPPPGDGEASVAERLERAHDEIEHLYREYLTAVRDGLRARERGQIAAAFDRGDALQGRMLATLHRARRLERELPSPASSAEPAAIRSLPKPS